MEINVFCMNCKVEILRADTDTLKSPMVGYMFRVKKDMEWSLFSPHDMGNDLICPMCDWAFHENGKIMIRINGDFVIGKPEFIIPGILEYDYTEEPIVETEVVLDTVEIKDVIVDGVNDITIEMLQKVVEGDKEPEIEEKPKINRGDWSIPSDIDEGIEDEIPKKKGGRPKGSKNKGAKYRNGRKNKKTS